jgi:NAD(P)H-hydrate epimerase
MLQEAAEIPDSTVIAIDIPSGLDADSGEAQKIPLAADLTVTFGGKKPAHVLAPARDLCGDVLCVDIGVPSFVQEKVIAQHSPALVVPDAEQLVIHDPWAKLARSAHKYDRGHVLVIGGSVGKTGAPLMAAMAAMRMGAGWVSVAMPEAAQKDLAGDVPREITFERLFMGGQIDSQALKQFVEERKVKAIVIGPGMTDSPLTPELLTTLAPLCERLQIQVTIDAGACQGLSDVLAEADIHPSRWVATPHPGEWHKIGPDFTQTPLSPSGLAACKLLVEDLGCAVLYKHATPILLAGDAQFPGFVTHEGTNVLARAGSGDLLAGMIGAHGARGLSAPEATLRSQVVLAWAAKLAARKRGVHSVLARDILDQIGRIDHLLDEEELDEE